MPRKPTTPQRRSIPTNRDHLRRKITALFPPGRSATDPWAITAPLDATSKGGSGWDDADSLRARPTNAQGSTEANDF